ncbi:mucin-2-like [Saccostrea cucullata]|uniref:mucin-2-like n=1 Tax=Saccostrea cuccullata TaxID=36930 RepID=UPI002ED0658A
METRIILTTFLLTLVVRCSKPCQQAIVLQDDTPVFISTPGFTEGKPYPTNTLCTWDISTYQGNIEVRFLSFDVEYDASCNWDFIEMYSGPCGGNNHVKYCGSTLPPVLTSISGRVCVEFYSDPYLTKPGFKARLLRVGKHEKSKNSSSGISTSTSNTNITTFPLPTTSLPFTSSTVSSSSSPPPTKESNTSSPGDSSANVGGSSGTLTSKNIEMCLTNIYHLDLKLKEKLELFTPGFRTGSKYPVNKHCSVSITATKNNTLKIHLLTLELEYHPQCLYDRLVVHDGPSHTSPVMLSLCGIHQSNVYLSTSDSVYIEFHSDIIIPAAGFKIVIENEPISTMPKILTTHPIESSETTTSEDILTTQNVQTIPSTISTTQNVQTTPSTILTTKNVQSTTPGAIMTTQNTQTPLTTTHGDILTTQKVLTSSPTKPSDIFTTQNVHTLPVTKTGDTAVQDVFTSTTSTSDSKQITTELLSTSSTVSADDKLTSSATTSRATTIASPATQLTLKSSKIPLTNTFLSTTTPTKDQNPVTKETAKSTTTLASPMSTNSKTVITLPLRILTVPTKITQTSSIPTTKLPKTSSFLTTILKSSTAHTTAVNQIKSTTAKTYNGTTETWITKQQSSTLATDALHVKASTIHKNMPSSSSPLSSFSTSSTTVAVRTSWTQRSSTSADISSSKTTVKSSPSTVTVPPSPSLPMECLGVDKVFSSLGRHVVQSPGMETGELYPNDVQCSWIFIAQDDQEIKIGFEMFDVEHEKDCKYDSLQLYNGSSVKSEVIKRYCGKELPSNFTFPGNQMYLLFISDRRVQSIGFKLNVDIVKKPTKTKNCLLGEKRCLDGSCVPSEWFCDGEIDCPDKSDEQVCGQCVSGEFRCTNGECISTYLRCDGKPDCSGHEDETDCFSLNDHSEILVKYNNKDLPICRDTWENKLAELICSDYFFRYKRSMIIYIYLNQH